MIAEIIPIKLLNKERKFVYDRKNEGDLAQIIVDDRKDSILEWQALCED